MILGYLNKRKSRWHLPCWPPPHSMRFPPTSPPSPALKPPSFLAQSRPARNICVMHDRSQLLTEQRLPESMRLDAMSIEDAVIVMNQQDARAVAAVAEQRDNIAAAIRLV